MPVLTTIEVANRLVGLCKEGNLEQVVEELYSDDIVSLEGMDSEAMPLRVEGIEGIRAKGESFDKQTEVHAMKTEGPFMGWRDDQFIARFELDATMKATGQRNVMCECALYTVKDGKIIQEEFLYLMGEKP